MPMTLLQAWPYYPFPISRHALPKAASDARRDWRCLRDRHSMLTTRINLCILRLRSLETDQSILKACYTISSNIKRAALDTFGLSCKIYSPHQPQDILDKAPLASQLKYTIVRWPKQHSSICSSLNALCMPRYTPLLRRSSSGRSLTKDIFDSVSEYPW